VGTTGFRDPVNNPYINLIRDPNNPFLGNATVHVGHIRRVHQHRNWRAMEGV